MPIALPESSRPLRRMLAQELAAAAIVIGFAAGGAPYMLEARRVEQAALERAAVGVRHFESPAMQMAIDAKAPAEHGALGRLDEETLQAQREQIRSKRPYKKLLALAEALTIIERDSNRRFDPGVVAVFKEIAPDLYARTIRGGNAEMRQGMRKALSQYFKTEAAPVRDATRGGESVG